MLMGRRVREEEGSKISTEHFRIEYSSRMKDCPEARKTFGGITIHKSFVQTFNEPDQRLNAQAIYFYLK